MVTRVGILASEGSAGRGGIARIMAYLERQMTADHPDIVISMHRTRLSEMPLLKHLTVPIALAAFGITCASGRLDLAHINVAPRGSTWRKLLYAHVARRCGVKVVLHLHGSGYDAFYASLNPVSQARVRALFQRADMSVALSDHWYRFLVEDLQVPASKVAQIANGVPDPGELLSRASLPEPCRIVFLGLVGERKGSDVLLDALARIGDRQGAWTLIVGGNGDVSTAAKQAADLGISDRVTFLGWVGEREVDELLRQADIFVLPSRAENQPVAILEAMARGVAVISTRVGAIPDQVSHETTGLLVDPADAGQLADALERLIASPDLRRAYGAAGRQRFAEKFSVRVYAARFAALYRELGAQGRAMRASM